MCRCKLPPSRPGSRLLRAVALDTRTPLPKSWTLHNKYVIKSVLGAGGFGITYKAHDRDLDVSVAIKEFFPPKASRRRPLFTVALATPLLLLGWPPANDGTFAPRVRPPFLGGKEFREGRDGFGAEAKLLAQVTQHGSRNVAHVYARFQQHDTAYIVMEFIRGETLAAAVIRAHFDERQAIALGRKMCGVLKLLHGGSLIHRDIKPSNIILRAANGEPVLIDFGNARRFGPGIDDLTGNLTPGYGPIEQYESSRQPQGPWTDVYALGATLYTVLTRRVPPTAPDRQTHGTPVRPVHDLRRDVSRTLSDAIDRAMILDPRHRLQSAAALDRLLLEAEMNLSPAGSG